MPYLRSKLPYEELIRIAQEEHGISPERALLANLFYLAACSGTDEVQFHCQKREEVLNESAHKLAEQVRVIEQFMLELPGQVAATMDSMIVSGMVNPELAKSDWEVMVSIMRAHNEEMDSYLSTQETPVTKH